MRGQQHDGRELYSAHSLHRPFLTTESPHARILGASHGIASHRITSHGIASFGTREREKRHDRPERTNQAGVDRRRPPYPHPLHPPPPNSRQMMAGLAGRKTARVSGPGRRWGGGAWGTAAVPASGAGGGFSAAARTSGAGSGPPSLFSAAAAAEGLTVMKLRGVGSEAESEPADPSRRYSKGGQSYRRGAYKYKVGGSSPPAPAPREYGPTSSSAASSSSYAPPASSSSRLCAPYASTSNLSAAAVAWDSMRRKSYGKGAFKDNSSSARGAGDYIGRLSSPPRSPSFYPPSPPRITRPFSPADSNRGAFTQSAAAAAANAAGAGEQGGDKVTPPAKQPRRARVPTPGMSQRAATRSAGAAASKKSARSSRPVTCAEWMARRSKAPARSPSRPMSVAKWMNSRVKT